VRASLFCCRLWPTSAQKLVPSGSPVYLALFESPLERLIIHTFMAVYVYGSCVDAARAGDLRTLQLLRRDGYPWDRDTCMFAARGGHFDILKWAHENGCKWDSFTCAFAAQRGHLEILEYLYDSRAPFSAKLGITNDKCKAFIEEYGPSWEKGEYRKLTKSQNIKG